MDRSEVDERVRFLEKCLEVPTKLFDIKSILRILLDVKRHYGKLIQILKPRQVVVSLDQIELPELLDVAKVEVVLV